MKRFKNSLVLGKFLPPHKGHLYLIDSAVAQSENVYVLCCSLEREPIPGVLRAKWLTQIYSESPNVKIIHVTDENPQSPEEDPDNFWDIWYKTVYSNVDKLDAIFTSEDYGYPFAKSLGIEHVLVDKDRVSYPVSGTAVRADAFANWNLIPDNVKEYFIKSVCLIGPESTGKTTLAQKLSKEFDTIWIPEYGREYCDKYGINCDANDLSHIAAGQIQSEDDLIHKANKIAIYDTDLIATQIWCEMYETKCPRWIVDASYQRECDLYLVTKPDVKWFDDGQRIFPHRRDWHFNRIIQELEKRGLNYEIVDGNYEQRFEKAVNIIKQKL